MQLYNFLNEPIFNQLREQMQASLIDESDLPYQDGISYAEIFELFDGEEVELAELEVKGSLFYHKGILVSLYIKDITGDGERLPRLHIALCKTLQEMKDGGRFQRYVSSCRADKTREVRSVKAHSQNSFQSSERELDVCQNCLNKLAWNGFGWHIDQKERIQIARDFNLSYFYKNYEVQFYEDFIKNLHTDHQEIPFNQYAKYWKKISYDYRKSKKWCCEQCGKNCQKQHGELHTHHINGQKNDNRVINLKALCYDCHAKQPFHNHMKKIVD